jgi:hypothetical protein
MPINRQTLLTDLKRWVTRFENDLREQCREHPELDARLKGQYDLTRKAGRTALAYSVWRDDELTQSAVAWVLSGVFVRFLEDNGLLETPFLSGAGEAREAASETRAAYFSAHRTHSDDDYLRHVFTEVGRLPGMADLLDARHNALWNASISGDAAKEFIEIWRRIDPATGSLAHDFADPEWDTRFLGDLYQDLSESARKKYALLQTPDFVEEFILDRTLDPAIDTFGLKEVRMIDPTCGSGHFVLGGFRRLLRLWQAARPDLGERELAVHALNGVYGVDINPFAVAIARFRLLLEAWRFCGVRRLRHAPDFHVNLAVGDSLLHGARFDSTGKPYVIGHQTLFGGEEAAFKDELAHCFAVEDVEALHRILGQQYHAVVGNPPYITVKDRAVSELYRARYPSCHRQYSLSVPFMERFFDLAIKGDGTRSSRAGFVGQITANSFMKREFGKKLIEEYLPRWDLTHVLDTSGAYIPGHGTPTVILFGKNQTPVSGTIRTVLGIRGEPPTPADPALGLVWQAIRRQIDDPGSESDWVSAGDSTRANFHTHPWSIGGGGMRELHDTINHAAQRSLDEVIETICSVAYTRLDEAYLLTHDVLNRQAVLQSNQIEFVCGDNVRDWSIAGPVGAGFPYDSELKPLPLVSGRGIHRLLWPFREDLWRRREINGDHRELGRTWWEWNRFLRHRFSEPKSISFAETATHNNFAFDDQRRVFSQTAPVIKPKPNTHASVCFQLTGLLNSSVGCFWLKQVCHCKGGQGVNEGAKAELWERFYQINATKIAAFPIPAHQPTQLPTALVQTSTALQAQSPAATLASWSGPESGELRTRLATARDQATCMRRQLIAWQEELDWQIYEAFGLVEGTDAVSLLDEVEQTTGHGEEQNEYQAGNLPRVSLAPCLSTSLSNCPPLSLGERAFEIVLVRRMAAGEVQTTWFERHKDCGSKPITELPSHWPAAYRELVERRIARIESDPNIRVIERPEYKRRWNTEPWTKRQQEALRQWLLTRLEAYFFDADRMVTGEDDAATAAKLAHVLPIRARFAAGGEPRLASTRQLATAAATDSQWMEAAAVYTGRHDFDVPKLVEDLVLAESVPALPADRYKAPGLRKRIEWEKTWDLQRQEDAVEAHVRREHPGKSEDDLKKLIRQAQQTEVGDIPVPPKYGSGDFTKTSYWKLRGKLDVPKERWILYPGAEGGHDASPVIAWAGWDHAQQAQALAGYYQQAKDTWGWSPTRLAPLLAALKDLLPWLHQWHNALDPTFGDRPSETYQHFYDTERQGLRLTEEEVEGLRRGVE